MESALDTGADFQTSKGKISRRGAKITSIRLYGGQINPTVGDIKNNFNLIARHIEDAKKMEADIAVFPELSLPGYPPEDLLLKPAFIKENLNFLDKLAGFTDNIIAIVGCAYSGEDLFNSAAVLCNKKISHLYHKQFLPNYSVFDEERYFQKGNSNTVLVVDGIRIGINICEDIYYSSGPASIQSITGGASLIINIAASPYYTGKVQEREKLLFTRAVDNRVNIFYVNLVGGQDELVFDGSSMAVNENGKILARAKPFSEDSLVLDLDLSGVNFSRLEDKKFKNQRAALQHSKVSLVSTGYKIKDKKRKLEACRDRYPKTVSCPEEEIFYALVTGTRDYVLKNGFHKAVLGLSGGIDSALTAVVASFALGNENVNALLMPSLYSSEGSIRDSEELSANLGINHIIVPITDMYECYLESLNHLLKTRQVNVTKENIQARIRGNILMAMANEYHWLVLATGNKSEISVGYSTLYGDMVGGFSPIKDVYKTMVYKICRFLNKKYSGLIPENIITKPPSAELKPGQKDEDKLPKYELLDSILKAYIEEEKDYESIVNMGMEPQVVKKVINMIDFSEYKRRQGAPGIKITSRAFGKDRRYPITNAFKLT
ncbi:MAG: NAD+ synthase [Actinomycetota bacterium]